MNRLNCYRLPVAALSIPLLWLACGPSFNKDEIKGNLSQPMEESNVNKINGLPKKSSKDLSQAEQGELETVVFNHMENKLDHKKVGKLFCHYNALGNEKKKCEDVRAECAKKVDELSVDDIKKKLAAKRGQIKAFIANQDIEPKLYVAAFNVLQQGMDIAATVDCDASKETLEQKKVEGLKSVAETYGQDDTKKISALLEAFLQLVGSLDK